ncbi:MFS general substrate transporter [Pseudovirgaria hyperparasitica]|uniref:MFS general substrate transporter n=1 Tax=Pseudovirgaria hyperparasitica TaxID=470096 RepID=A0A6A6W2Z3_9PEZI|nr:MFS general substrate transporter [Pseudovirgaria hyperparasitica]KAF2756330.1 MFS general substrate transporter [Pseudovirgaria hyperparasitica]
MGLDTSESQPTFQHTWRIRCIFAVLCIFSFLGALDSTIITTSLLTIIRQIGGEEQLYVWVAHSFLFASTAPQPIFGQIADIFGRRYPFLVCITCFALGSGISGGAGSAAMLIAGRTVQGLGTAGLFVLSDIIICDIVPPRYRGPYLSAVLSTAGIGSTIGPSIGGALAESSWRWIFYMNLPICGVGFLGTLLLMNIEEHRPRHITLRQVDFFGMSLFVVSMIALFYGLITGGIQHPWSSWRVILPLVLGTCGWIAFHVFEASRFCGIPSAPPRLFLTRTSVAGFLMVFFSSVVFQAIAYFLPLYFQAVRLASPLDSGVYFLPFALSFIVFAGFAGWCLSKWGYYVPLHYAGFGLLAIGMGLFSTLTQSSSTGYWVGLQLLPSAGIAFIFTATLPSTLAALPEKDVAVATAMYSFIRAFGLVWGVTLSGVVFNGQFDANIGLISADNIRTLLKGGAAYSFGATSDPNAGIRALDGAIQGQVQEVYVKALRVVWLVIMSMALLGFVCVPIERQLELRTESEPTTSSDTAD